MPMFGQLNQDLKVWQVSDEDRPETANTQRRNGNHLPVGCGDAISVVLL